MSVGRLTFRIFMLGYFSAMAGYALVKDKYLMLVICLGFIALVSWALAETIKKP